jgi:cyanophycin synthetase
MVAGMMRVMVCMSDGRRLEKLPAQRRLVLIGQAGDRNDDLMCGLVQSTPLCRPGRVLIKKSLHDLRSRQQGEVPELLRNFPTEQGFAPEAISVHADELNAVAAALAWSEPADLLVPLIHDDFVPAVAPLHEHGAVGGRLPVSR